MTVVQERTGIDRQRLRQRTRFRMLYMSALIALLVVFVVQTGTRYVLNDWTVERLERIMEYNIHRRVELGKTTWSLGLNGLIIATSSINIANRQDPKSTFIDSGYSEIGVPLLPMLAGEMQVRYLRFLNPKMWAIQVGPHEWNFSDLPHVAALRNIAFIDMEGGLFTVIDRSKPIPARWSPRVFEHTYFHLERPFQRNQWPFSFSFDIPHKQYKTTVTVSGVGNGAVDDWAKNRHTFALRARQINLNDFQDLFTSPPPISGLLNVDLNGEGIPSKDFEAHATITSPMLTVAPPGFGAITIHNGVIAGDFNLSDELLRWQNVIVHLGGFDLHTEGQMYHWRTKQPIFNTAVTATTENLESLAKFLPAQLLPKALLPAPMAQRVAADKHHLITVEQAIYPARLSGRGYVQAHVTGKGLKTHAIANVSASGIKLYDLADLRPFKQFPILGLLGANPTAQLGIDMILQPTGRSVINAGTIYVGNSRILMNGYMFLAENKTHLSYYSGDLHLVDFVGGMSHTEDRGRVNRALGLPENADIALSGNAQLNGIADSTDNQTSIHAIATLMNAGVALNSGRFRASKINGKLYVSDELIYADNITGTLASGAFRLAGYIPTKRTGVMDVVYQGKTIDLAAIRAAASALQVKAPILTNPYLQGRINNIYLLLRGTKEHPVISFSGQPRQLAFQSPTAPGRVVITGGTIQIHNNEVYLQKLLGTLGKGNFSVTGNLATNASNIVMEGHNIDIAQFRQAMLDLKVKAPIVTDPEVLFGRLRYGLLSVRTQGKASQFQLRGSPEDVYYQPQHVPRTFILTGGNFYLDNDRMNFNRVTGTLGKGVFTLTGNWIFKPSQYTDLAFSGKNLDLSTLKLALQALNVKSPLLAEQALFGKVRRLDFNMKGTPTAPQLSVLAYPQDVYLQAFGTRRAFHLLGGVVSYKNDELVLNQVKIVNGRSVAHISLALTDLSHHSHLRELHLKTPSFDIGDLSAYLSQPRTPPMVRTRYVALLQQYGVKGLHGKLAGSIDVTAGAAQAPEQFALNANVHLIGVGFNLHGLPFHNLNGRLYTAGPDLLVDNLTGAAGASIFALNGLIADVESPSRTWRAQAIARLDVNDLLARLPFEKYKSLVRTSAPIPVTLSIVGSSSRTAIQFASSVGARSTLTIHTARGSFSKPANVPINLSGMLAYTPGTPATVSFSDTTLSMGNMSLAWQGQYTLPYGGEPGSINFVVSLPKPLPLQEALSLLPLPQNMQQYAAGAGGSIAGNITFVGQLPNPQVGGQLSFYNVSLPALHLANINGSIGLPDLLAARHATTVHVNICFAAIIYQKFEVTNVHGDATLERTDDGPQLRLNQLTANAYGGTLSLTGSLLLNAERPFDLQTQIQDMDLNQLSTQAFQKPDAITGMLDAVAHVRGQAADPKCILSTLTGSGKFMMSNGQIKSLGKLETGISELRLLKQGLLGLNLSNIMNALSKKTHSGVYDYFSGELSICNAVLAMEQLYFESNELRMWGRGVLDLITERARIDVAGNIPRTSKAFNGPLGDALRHLSVSGLLDFVTQHALANFPDIPIIGTLSEAKPRAFEYTLAGHLKDPDSFTKSFKKTFKWLPNQPHATPHPVFGITCQPEEAVH